MHAFRATETLVLAHAHTPQTGEHKLPQTRPAQTDTDRRTPAPYTRASEIQKPLSVDCRNLAVDQAEATFYS